MMLLTRGKPKPKRTRSTQRLKLGSWRRCRTRKKKKVSDAFEELLQRREEEEETHEDKEAETERAELEAATTPLELTEARDCWVTDEAEARDA